MNEQDRKLFDQVLDNISATLKCDILPGYVKDSYWKVLKPISTDQLISVATKLTSGYKKKWSDDFPLPAHFLEAIAPSYHKESTPQRNKRVSDFEQVSEIIPQLLDLMPLPGKFNTDEEAATMVSKMDAIIDRAFQGIPPTKFECDQCDDTGFVHCWFQFKPGLDWYGNEVISERVTNSPYWISKCGGPNPMPELQPKLTPCIARCLCRLGDSRPDSIPLSSHFKELA